MKTVKGLLLGLFVAALSVIGISSVVSQPLYAADASSAVCEALGATGASNGCSNTGGSNVSSVLKVALQLLSFVAGVIAVIMIIIAGVKFITSGGDAGKVASARNTIIYALVGAVIVVVSQAIVQFVINRAT